MGNIADKFIYKKNLVVLQKKYSVSREFMTVIDSRIFAEETRIFLDRIYRIYKIYTDTLKKFRAKPAKMKEKKPRKHGEFWTGIAMIIPGFSGWMERGCTRIMRISTDKKWFCAKIAKTMKNRQDTEN